VRKKYVYFNPEERRYQGKKKETVYISTPRSTDGLLHQKIKQRTGSRWVARIDLEHPLPLDFLTDVSRESMCFLTGA